MPPYQAAQGSSRRPVQPPPSFIDPIKQRRKAEGGGEGSLIFEGSDGVGGKRRFPARSLERSVAPRRSPPAAKLSLGGTHSAGRGPQASIFHRPGGNKKVVGLRLSKGKPKQ